MQHLQNTRGAGLSTFQHYRRVLRPIPFVFKLLRTLWHGEKRNSFLFSRFRTLCQKTPGVGGGCRLLISQVSSQHARRCCANLSYYSVSVNSAISATSALIPFPFFDFQLSTFDLPIPGPHALPRTRSSTSSIFSPSRWSFRAKP